MPISGVSRHPTVDPQNNQCTSRGTAQMLPHASASAVLPRYCPRYCPLHQPLLHREELTHLIGLIQQNANVVALVAQVVWVALLGQRPVSAFYLLQRSIIINLSRTITASIQVRQLELVVPAGWQ
jgi:hypothetical protein